MPLLVATRNEHKLRELREALPGVELEPLPAGVELPPEEGDTFAANAIGRSDPSPVSGGSSTPCGSGSISMPASASRSSRSLWSFRVARTSADIAGLDDR